MDQANIWKEPIPGDFKVTHNQNTAWQMTRFHYHDVYEIFLAMSDQAQYFIEDRVYDIHKGDVFVFNNRDIHKSVPGSGQPYDRYILVFQPDFAAGLSTAATDLLACFHNRPLGFPYCIHPADADWEKLVDLFEEGIRLAGDGQYGADIRKRLCLGSILLLLNTLYQQEPVNLRLSGSRRYQRIHQILQHIQQNLAGDLSLDTLAGTFFLSKHHLNVLFRQATGFSINEYVISCRLSRARELLTQDRSVSQVAEAVGYANSAHFIRIFKARIGQTPGQYARQLPGCGAQVQTEIFRLK